MKLAKNWKRIFAGMMAAIMVFLSIDAGCMTALAAEIQTNGNTEEMSLNMPTGGLLPLEVIEVSEDEVGEVLDYEVLASMKSYGVEDNEWFQYSTRYYYNQLDDKWREVWDALDVLMLSILLEEDADVNQYLSLPTNITLNELLMFVELYMESNPQFYFLRGGVGYSYVGDRIPTSFRISLYNTYIDGEDRIAATEFIKDEIHSVKAIINNSIITNSSIPTQEEILLAIHDYVVKNTQYDHDIIVDNITDEEEELWQSQNVYGILKYGKTVCAGYTDLMQLLCNSYGIDAINVTSSNHAWNKVRINDSWYNIDATWADPILNGNPIDTEDKPVFYTYYGRSDSFYEADNSSHVMESKWLSYVPKCTLDSELPENYQGYNEALVVRYFELPEGKMTSPIIKSTKVENDTYSVTISLPVNDEIDYTDAIIYYTTDGTIPSEAKTKAYRYDGAFEVTGDYEIQAIAVLNGYYDSDVVLYTGDLIVPSVEGPVINDHFYNKMTLHWNAVEEATGYLLNIYKGTEKLESNIIKTVKIEDKDTTSYVLDTSAHDASETIFFEIYAYAGEEEEVLSEPTLSQNYKTKGQAVDVGVKWHVTTIEGVEYLVIDVTENLIGDQEPASTLLLWYYSDISEIKEKSSFKVEMSNATGYVMYEEGNKYNISYLDEGYIFITNADKSSAFQQNGFKVGGDYIEPELEAIPDVKLEEKDQSVTLKAQISNATQMENFNYTYQWYVAEDESSMGTPILGANKATLTVKPGSFEEKFYYCEVTVSYPVEGVENQIFITDNGVESEFGEKGHTRILGELYGTDLHIAELSEQTYTGAEIKPEITVTDKQTGEVLVAGEDYDVVYSNNINVSQEYAVGHVTFKGDYVDAPEATVKFKINPKSGFKATDIELFDPEDKIYTGEKFEPKGEIVDTTRNVVLVEGVDYELKYYSNQNAGTANITVKFIGNYCDEDYIIFTISPKSCADVSITNNESQIYAGFAIEPTFLVVKDGEKTLEYKKDYVFETTNNTNIGTATVKVVFVGNYVGDKTVRFSINAKSADDLMIDSIADCEYTGSAITPALTIVYVNGSSSVVLQDTIDYDATYTNNVACGTATVTIRFKGNYTDNGTPRTVTYNIVPKNADKLTYSEFKSYVYTGAPHTPGVSVMNGNIPLVEGRDFIVEYADNINAGNAKAIVKFDGFEGCSGNYAGTKELTFQIAPKVAFDCSVTLETLEDYTFTGLEFKPGVVVMDGETLLVERTEEMEENEGDYVVSYTNNVNAGEATVIITFINNYVGETSKTFTIDRKPITEEHIVIEPIADQVYIGETILPENIVVKDTLTGVTLRPDEDYTVAPGAENVYVGTGKVVVSIELEGNYIYTGEALEASFNIVARNASNVEISPIPTQRYTGSEITPVLEVKDGEIVLILGVDYTVSYENNIEVGEEAKVIISFIGNFVGEDKSATFTIIDPIPEYITSSSFNINELNGYISKITAGTTVFTLHNAINESDYVSIFDKSGNPASVESILTTGMKAAIMDGSQVVKDYIIIVTGDTNGDGKINITDMIAVKACSLKKSDLTGAYEKAADVNGDGKINITDFIKVKATTLKKDTITGVAVN